MTRHARQTAVAPTVSTGRSRRRIFPVTRNRQNRTNKTAARKNAPVYFKRGKRITIPGSRLFRAYYRLTINIITTAGTNVSRDKRDFTERTIGPVVTLRYQTVAGKQKPRVFFADSLFIVAVYSPESVHQSVVGRKFQQYLKFFGSF